MDLHHILRFQRATRQLLTLEGQNGAKHDIAIVMPVYKTGLGAYARLKWWFVRASHPVLLVKSELRHCYSSRTLNYDAGVLPAYTTRAEARSRG